MINVTCLSLGEYQTNCYIVWKDDSPDCAVIDPGCSPDILLSAVSALGKTLSAILLTHGHFDHVGAVEALVEKTGCALWMCESDWSQFPNPVNRFYYPLANCDFTEVRFCEDGERIRVGTLCFDAIATPGHTWGSMCFRCEDALFTGDTLFQASVGRTDLPGGDADTLMESLERLKELPENLTVYPGHGGTTSLDHERNHNPYLR